MDWREAAGYGAGDEPGPGFGPPRHGAGPADNGVLPPDEHGARRDERLTGFAAGGEWDTRTPSAELVQVLESVSGPGWRCPGATDDEMVGVVRRWAAVESWAGAAKLGAIRELIRREDKPWLPTDQHVDQPDPWSESLTHELALALAASVGSADRTEWLSWELGTRLPGIDALLTDGTLSYGKAKAVAEAFGHLSDVDAAHAEALILSQLAGKTYRQILRLAAAAASKADPDGDERRRKDAEKQAARVRLWREHSGAAALAGFDLPTDEALAAHANVSARAERYKASGAFPEEKMDQLRAMSYLDLLNGVTPETRIASTRDRPAAGPAGSAATPDTPGDGGVGPDDDAGGGGSGAASSGTDLVIPLVTLLGLGNRPGESHQFGPLDPALCRELGAIAAGSPATRLCVTVTDQDGIAIGHGCARPRRRPGQVRQDPRPALAALPARMNLTIPLADLQDLASFVNAGSVNARPASRGSPWAFTPHVGDPSPPAGHGTWTLTIPGGRDLIVHLEPVPTYACDHAHESHAYQPNDTLRHLVQVRDGDCTFPPCSRHARESDFEHAVPYHRGGRTCCCNAGARSRRCHRIKQSTGWHVTQPRPGFHQWTTPAGRTYTQEPKRYPA